VPPPKDIPAYLHYFGAADTADKNELLKNEPKRVSLYKLAAALIRAYTNLANEMEAAGYSGEEIRQIKQEVTFYSDLRDMVVFNSGDRVDMKQYEPAMRHLLDTYIRAHDSRKISAFDDRGLIELFALNGSKVLKNLPEGITGNPEAMAETIENNLRRIIIDERPINPKYYERMSELLDALIKERREKALDYQTLLKKYEDLSVQTMNSAVKSKYPPRINSKGKQALYDNLNQDLELTLSIDKAVRESKKDGWRGNNYKEKTIRIAIRAELTEPDDNLEDMIFGIIKAQRNDY
jgi:type I restriction enzyme R subunit